MPLHGNIHSPVQTLPYEPEFEFTPSTKSEYETTADYKNHTISYPQAVGVALDVPQASGMSFLLLSTEPLQLFSLGWMSQGGTQGGLIG